METYTLLIRDVHLGGRKGRFWVGVVGTSVRRVAPVDTPVIPGPGCTVLEGRSGFLSPGFVDIHLHLDKAGIGGGGAHGLMDALRIFKDYGKQRFSREDIVNRAVPVLQRMIRNGTTAARTHVSVDDTVGLVAVEAALELRERFRSAIDLQIIAMLGKPDMDPACAEVMAEAGRLPIDGFGGGPAVSQDPKAQLDGLFSLAERYGKTLDIHADEHDRPDVSTTERFARQLIERKWEGAVAGHLCSLSAVPQDRARKTIGLLGEAGVHVVTLPSSNLFLMGREDPGPIRRGVTRIRELDEAGVNVCVASDNIRDPFRPFGNGDMLEEMLLTAQVAQMGSREQLEMVFEMGTANPARAFGYAETGVHPGCRADLVLLEAPSAPDAILDQCNRRYVIKGGRVVCENRKTSEDLYGEG